MYYYTVDILDEHSVFCLRFTNPGLLLSTLQDIGEANRNNILYLWVDFYNAGKGGTKRLICYPKSFLRTSDIYYDPEGEDYGTYMYKTVNKIKAEISSQSFRLSRYLKKCWGSLGYIFLFLCEQRCTLMFCLSMNYSSLSVSGLLAPVFRWDVSSASTLLICPVPSL